MDNKGDKMNYDSTEMGSEELKCTFKQFVKIIDQLGLKPEVQTVKGSMRWSSIPPENVFKSRKYSGYWKETRYKDVETQVVFFQYKNKEYLVTSHKFSRSRKSANNVGRLLEIIKENQELPLGFVGFGKGFTAYSKDPRLTVWEKDSRNIGW